MTSSALCQSNVIPTGTSFHPYASVGAGEGFFWNEKDKAFYPSVNCALGCAYSLTDNIHLLVSASYSATFTRETKLYPVSTVSGVNHRFGADVGCAVSFGKGGAK